jgi:hypothetical protein
MKTKNIKINNEINMLNIIKVLASLITLALFLSLKDFVNSLMNKVGTERSIIVINPIGLNIFINAIEANSLVEKFLNSIAVTIIFKIAVKINPAPLMNVFL